MSLEVKRKIKASAAAFMDKLWPLIQGSLGGGRIVSVESVSDQDFFTQCLDMYSGIDMWHVNDQRCLIRGLATRMQHTRRVFRTITIRYKRMTGASTEIDKRLKELQEPGNWLHPSLVVQGYFHETPDRGYGDPRAVAIARMQDVIRVIVEGRQGKDFRDPGDWYIDTTSSKYGNSDNTQFAVVPIDSLDRAKHKVKWLEF